jgi:superfamily I DNA/RNA helicase
MLDRGLRQQKAEITADRKLTSEGKYAAADTARTATRAAITEWHEQRLKNIDADMLEQRAALLSDASTPDLKHVELMASHLQKYAPQELAVFYNSATEPERRAMEAASAAVGRVPMKTANGLEWKTLLEPEMVNDAIMARAEATNPTAAQKVRELTEIRAMQVTITGVALAEI